MHPYISLLQKIFHRNRNQSNAVAMKAYMRDQFSFFGIKSTPRRALSSEYMKSACLPEGAELRKIISELWIMPEREYQYFAIELLIKTKSQWNKKDSDLFEHLITNNPWWDTVDYLSSWVIGPWLQMFPNKIKPLTGKWNNSDNIWLQRMSLLFQLKYKEHLDTKLLTKYILKLSKSKEFFIQKAIGWVLREYSKTDPEWVKNFLMENEIMPLSMREAKKVINKVITISKR